jgi:hypothetical protein
MRPVRATLRHHDDVKIVEATATKNGSGLLVEFRASDDGGALFVYPYRADREVYLVTREHDRTCGAYQHGTPVHCDCGACSTFDAKAGRWIPTRKTGAA